MAAINLAILAIIRMATEAMVSVARLPDWQDSQSVREWLRELLPTIGQIARQTVTTVDDATVALFRAIVEVDSLWESVWAAVTELINPNTPKALSQQTVERIRKACAEADSNRGSFDPETVIAIVEAVIDLGRVCCGLRQPTAPPLTGLRPEPKKAATT